MKRKKLLSVLLTLALCLGFLPATARAELSVYVGNQLLTDGQKYAVTGTVGSQTLQTTTADDNYVLWKSDTTTLTLHNVTFNGSGYDHSAIHANENLTICLEGTNTITLAENANNVCFGILTSGSKDITITGGGTLTITAGNSTGTSNSYGVYCHDLTVNAGTLHAVGGASNEGDSYGIWAGHNVTVGQNGKLIGVSGNGKGSYGVYVTNEAAVSGTLYVNAGNEGSVVDPLPAASGNGDYPGGGIWSNTFTVQSGGTVKAYAPTAANGGAVAGIRISDVATVSGTVYAEGATAKGSYGVWVTNGSATVTGSLTAKGGTATVDSSYGIYTNGDASISGTVNATGGAATTDNSIGICTRGDVTVSGGTVNATGGSGGYGSYGWSAEGGTGSTFALSDGTVNAIGDACAGLGGGTGNASFGIAFNTLANITGGTLNATGGNNTTTANSYGICFNSGDTVTISGGTVAAKGGTTTGGSYGGYFFTGTAATTLVVNNDDTLTSATFQGNTRALSADWTIPTGVRATVSENYDGSGTTATRTAGDVVYSGSKYAQLTPAPAQHDLTIHVGAHSTLTSAAAVGAINVTTQKYTGDTVNDTVTAAAGYHFPATHTSYTTTSGITVTRTDATTLTITGLMPDADVTVTLPNAVANEFEFKIAFGAGVTWDGVNGPHTEDPIQIAAGEDLGTDDFYAMTGYTFPSDYVSHCTGGSDGVVITRVSSTHVTVTGTMPAANVYVILPDATPVPVNPQEPFVPATTPAALVTEIDSGDSTTTTNISALVTQGKTLTVNADDGASVVLDTPALRGIDNVTNGDVTVTLTQVPAAAPTADGTAAKGYSLTVSTQQGATVENYGGTVTVTLPYAITPTQNPARVTVYEQSGGTATPVPGATYDAASGTVTMTVSGDSTTYVVVYQAMPYTDVKPGDYFYEAVDWADLTGITHGTDEVSFSPNAPASRAETVTFLWRAAGCPEPKTASNPFSDVDPGAYYYKAVLWAAENGITLGDGEGGFDPSGIVTRAQFAAFLYRLIKMNGGGFTDAWAFPLDFTDADNVPEWAYEAFCFLTMEGIVLGADGALSPLDDCVRAQIVTMLYRYFAG